jgi:hypothetical protein
MEFLYQGEIAKAELDDLRSLDGSGTYQAAIDAVATKSRAHETILKGSLQKVSIGAIAKALEPDASVFFCPLLTTEHALGRLAPLLERLPAQFSRTQILTGAVIDSRVTITDATSPIGALCEKYYDESLGDEHTGNIKFGFDGCGLPLVLHHNTPNNSLYLLWARRSNTVEPLFVRYERHGREGL